MRKNFMSKIFMFASVLTVCLCMSVGVFGAGDDTNINISNMKVKWADEFNGTALSASNWTCQIGNGSRYGIWEWGNNEKEWYKAENVIVSNGTLKINAKYEPGAGKSGNTTYNFSSARFNSAGKVEIGLGYVEARIKMPSAPGIWPAFWMLGTNGKTWPSCGEIDIMEAFNTRNTLQSTIHYNNWDGGDVYLYCQRNDLLKTDWHTFGCYRDGENCTFYIDRQRIGSYKTADIATGANAGQRSVLNDNYYILFNVACGGNLAQGMPNTDLDVNMEVDYVRYYVNKTAEELAAEEASRKAAEEASRKAAEEASRKAAEEASRKAAEEAAKAAKPKKAVIQSLKNVKKKKFKLTIKKIKGVKGYRVRWCDNKKFNGYEEKKIKKPKLTVKGLDKKTTYWVKVRAYKVYNGKTINGPWSKPKKIKIKK